MHASFSFCGTDIESLGLYYAPEMQDTYVYKPAEYQSHIETFDGHDGGYYYGSWYSPKEFTLRCYFEEKQIDMGLMDKVFAMFRIGRSGKLIFSRRPWCYYYATVTEPIKPDFSNYLNGTVTIHMKAMYPFARSNIITNLRSEKYHDVLMTSSAVFDKHEMEINNRPTAKPEDVEDKSIPDWQKDTIEITAEKTIALCNPGSEYAACGIRIAGDVGRGVVISNKTTGQSCKFVAITPELVGENNHVYCDAISGKTVVIGPSLDKPKIAFLYHDYGFLSLAPSHPATRDIYIKYTAESSRNIVETSNILSQDYTGQYIFLDGSWHKINEQPDKHTLLVDGEISKRGTERTMIIRMNEITIKPVSTMCLTRLEFVFSPTYL